MNPMYEFQAHAKLPVENRKDNQETGPVPDAETLSKQGRHSRYFRCLDERSIGNQYNHICAQRTS